MPVWTRPIHLNHCLVILSVSVDNSRTIHTNVVLVIHSELDFILHIDKCYLNVETVFYGQGMSQHH